MDLDAGGNRIEETLNFVLRKGIKVAYIKGKRLVLPKHENYAMNKPYPRPLSILKSEVET
ncbi:hypothetical protein [Paenibacillus sp. FSL M7-0420]|uniref:hypothetical protein n=1 Tax=Paenibacillus sp. FSL M7-0420 TaxID=2921609 RepID=UPI0030F6590F